MIVYITVGIMLAAFIVFAYVMKKYSTDKDIDMFRWLHYRLRAQHPFLPPGTSQKEYRDFDVKHFNIIFYLSILVIYITFIQAYFLFHYSIVLVMFVVINIFLYFIKKKKWTGLLKFFLIIAVVCLVVWGMFIYAKCSSFY